MTSIISQTAEYALRAIVHLATVAGTDAPPQNVGQIAAGTRVPAGYLAKVLQSLSRNGLITSQRGTGGGFRLAKAPHQTSIYEVVQAVDPLQRIQTCPLKLAAHGAHLCPLHKRLDNAVAVIEEQFLTTMISELIEESQIVRSSSRPADACAFPITLSTPAAERKSRGKEKPA